MPKRKLSSKSTDALRQAIKKAIQAGTKRIEVLRNVSKKYGLSEMGARYHYNAVAKELEGDRRKKPGPTNRSASPSTHAVQASFKLIQLAEKGYKRLGDAKKLGSKLTAELSKEREIHRDMNKLHKRLQTLRKRAQLKRSVIDKLERDIEKRIQSS